MARGAFPPRDCARKPSFSPCLACCLLLMLPLLPAVGLLLSLATFASPLARLLLPLFLPTPLPFME